MNIQTIINTVDVSSKVQSFRVEDTGISRVSSAVVVLFGKNSVIGDVADYHDEIKVNITPESSQYNIFGGWIWNYRKTLVRPPDYIRLTLDCRGIGQRLADDTITFDYWKAQMAINPMSDPDKAWTFRKVINDFLAIPDSGYDTGFTVDAATGGNIDNIIDASCSFERQTLLDAIRMICDRIGYDGYIDTDAELNKKVFLRPYDKSSTATVTTPYIEFEWDSGSLDDVFNYILVWGGVDEGVPKFDRFTEYGVSKYSPAIWTVSGNCGGTLSIEDVSNTDFGEFAVNDMAVKASVTDPTNKQEYLEATLYPAANANSGISTFDCENRLTSLNFYIVANADSVAGLYSPAVIKLEDTSGNVIRRFFTGEEWKPKQPSFVNGKVYLITFGVGKEETIKDYTDSWIPHWMYVSGSSFDWKNVSKITIAMRPWNMYAGNWSFQIDGFHFVGGLEIDPFAEYADELCPPKYDSTSIDNHGVHLLHHQDTLLDDFDIANNEGDRVLGNLKNPVPTIKFTIPAWSSLLRPSDVITVQSPIFNGDVRIISCEYRWESRTKRIRQTITATSKLNPLPPYWSWEPTLRYLVK